MADIFRFNSAGKAVRETPWILTLLCGGRPFARALLYTLCRELDFQPARERAHRGRGLDRARGVARALDRGFVDHLLARRHVADDGACVLGRALEADERLAEIWMLRQPDAVRESYVNEVLLPALPPKLRQQKL